MNRLIAIGKNSEFMPVNTLVNRLLYGTPIHPREANEIARASHLRTLASLDQMSGDIARLRKICSGDR